MMTKMWSQRRTMWIATGAGIVMLTLGSWFMTGWERHQVLPPDEKTSDQSQTEQKERSLQGMPMSPSQETGPPQAYAMVTPTKQQLIGVKTAVALHKFNVDTLGRIYPAKPEVRRGLA